MTDETPSTKSDLENQEEGSPPAKDATATEAAASTTSENASATEPATSVRAGGPPSGPKDAPPTQQKEPQRSQSVAQQEQPGSQELNPQRVQQGQQKGRAENLDFFQVLRQFAGAGSAPQIWIGSLSVAQDMLLGASGGVSSTDIYPPPQRDSAQVTPEEIRKIKEVYQRHAAFPTALKALQQKRCVILHGRPQVGKQAAAIRLALELCGDDVAIWELSPEEDPLKQINTLVLEPSTVYLIDGLLREQGRALKRPAARNLLDTLAKQECYLIICARLEVPFPPVLPAVRLEPTAVPAEVMLEAHLDFYGPLSPEQTQSVLNSPQVIQLLKQGIPAVLVDRLAKNLANYLISGGNIEEALHGFAAASEEDVRKWLDETADNVEESAFRIAVAALSGARYTFVDKAAKVLARQLHPELDTRAIAESPAYVSPLKKKRRRQRLQDAHARLVDRPIITEYSENALTQVVELENPGYPTALLKYIWTEIDEWREPVLRWLCDHAVEGPRDLRLRAAGAIGALAGLDFEYVSAHVFFRWATTSSDYPDQRRKHYQALANAMGVLIWNDDRAEDVLGLLRAWVDDGSDALKWAAARTYAQVGLRYPHEAINQWQRILESKEQIDLRITESFGLVLPHPLHMSVIDAIISLFSRAAEWPQRLRPVFEEALEGLAEWVEADARESTSMQVGLPLFLFLTEIGYPPDDGQGDPDEWPPAMLYIINTQPDSIYRRVLAGLLRHALNHRDFLIRQWADATLRDWTQHANSDPWLEQPLTALLQEMLDLGASERERNRLSVQLTRWANHPLTPMSVAQRLLEKLNLD